MLTVEMLFDENSLELGIDALSLVERPATKGLWVTMNEALGLQFKTLDKEKRIIMGPALIPNQLVLREQEFHGVYQKFNIFFSADTIEKAAHQYLIRGNQKNSTLEHEVKISDVTLVESWIKSDDKNDKSNQYPELSKYPKGTWFVGLKVLNTEIWDDYVKTGRVKGISIEGNFADKIIEMTSHVSDGAQSKVDLIKSIIDEYQK